MEIIIDGSIKNLTNDQLIKVLKSWTESKRGRGAKLAAIVWPERNKNAQSVVLPSIKGDRYKPTLFVWQKIINGMELVEKQEKEIKKSVIKPTSPRVKLIKKSLNSTLPKEKETVKTTETVLLKGADKENFVKFAYYGIDPSKVTDEMIFGDKKAFTDNLYHFSAHCADDSIKSQLYIIDQWLKEDRHCKLKLADVTYMMNFNRNESKGFTNLIGNIMTDENFIRLTKIMIKVDNLIEFNSPFASAARRSA